MRMKRHGRLLATGVSATLVVFSLAAASASSANISHSYKAVKSVRDGSIVSLDPERSEYVKPANVDNGSRLFGIAVASNNSLLAVNPGPNTVQVATSGTANGLVSTLNGDIKVGDQIGVSPFDGVGMKAAAGSQVIGLAQTGFNGSSAGSTTEQVTDKNHNTRDIRVGYARISIAVGANATAGAVSNLTSLQKLVQSVTGHTVSNTRAIISLAVVIISLLALITLVYASIYGSIISVGRNPLAKYTVFRTLSSVLGMAALITLVAAVAVYLLLR